MDIASDPFLAAYVECALWSSTDTEPPPPHDCPWRRTETVLGAPFCSVCDAAQDNPPFNLDDRYDWTDIAPGTLESMRADCDDFRSANAADLEAFADALGDEQAGHDFWLTRNGHGAGFWDRFPAPPLDAGSPERTAALTAERLPLHELGQRLSAAAEVYGSVDLYVGDDGRVHS